MGAEKPPKKKKQIPGNGGSQELFQTNVPLILPVFSVFSVGGGAKKFPGTLFLGTFFFLF